ncbi:hypothetical protein BD560DRAFT_341275, partial [Blakeslea trispora]
YSQADASFINSKWADHALLTLTYAITSPREGKGLWRTNPNLVNIPSYVQKIHKGIDIYVERHLSSNDHSPQDHWNSIKDVVAKLTRNYSRFRTNWREKRLKELQQQRNHLHRWKY